MAVTPHGSLGEAAVATLYFGVLLESSSLRVGYALSSFWGWLEEQQVLGNWNGDKRAGFQGSPCSPGCCFWSSLAGEQSPWASPVPSWDLLHRLLAGRFICPLCASTPGDVQPEAASWFIPRENSPLSWRSLLYFLFFFFKSALQNDPIVAHWNPKL